MDGLSFSLAIFLFATFAGALVAGLSGFAFGLIAASMWLYVLSPLQTATLIVAFGLIVQGYSVWKLRAAVDWRKLWPFVLGAAAGVPLGVFTLALANPSHVRAGTGAFLVAFSLWSLLRPAMKPVASGGTIADAAVGFLNGVLAGITGLAGNPGDDLVRAARLAAGPAARGVSAQRGRDLSHDRGLARCRDHDRCRYLVAVPARAACAACRHVAWHESLRQARRSSLPQGGARAPAQPRDLP